MSNNTKITKVLVKMDCGLILEDYAILDYDIPSESYCICSDDDCRGTEFILNDLEDHLYINEKIEEKVTASNLQHVISAIITLNEYLFINDKTNLEISQNIIEILKEIAKNIDRGNSIEVNKNYNKLLHDLHYYIKNCNPHEFFINLYENWK